MACFRGFIIKYVNIVKKDKKSIDFIKNMIIISLLLFFNFYFYGNNRKRT
jgi:hypothetical protein